MKELRHERLLRESFALVEDNQLLEVNEATLLPFKTTYSEKPRNELLESLEALD